MFKDGGSPISQAFKNQKQVMSPELKMFQFPEFICSNINHSMIDLFCLDIHQVFDKKVNKLKFYKE